MMPNTSNDVKDVFFRYGCRVLPMLLIALLVILSGCGAPQRVPESRVLTNLQRAFPGRTFELHYNFIHQSTAGIGFTTFSSRNIPAWRVHELDTGAIHTLIDGNEHELEMMLRRMVDSLTSRWNYNLSNILIEELSKLYPPSSVPSLRFDGSRIARLSFYTNPTRRDEGGWSSNISPNSSVRFRNIEGFNDWLLGIEGFEEGFVALANYERIQSMQLSVRYSISVDDERGIDIEEEAIRNKAIIQEFILPIYKLLQDTGMMLSINMTVTYVTPFERGQVATHFGQFNWVYDPALDGELTYGKISELDLRGYFEMRE